MQNDKLLPCPFCGGEAETTFICDGRYNQIKCKTPKCIMNVDMPAFYGTKEEAIKRWNQRKPMERIVEQLEDYRRNYDSGLGDFTNELCDRIFRNVIDIARKGGVDNATN